jgi:hypothetical protein
MCFVWISVQTSIISRQNVSWLGFIPEMEFVYCAVRNESLNTWHFIMFCMIKNIYNQKTKGPTLMELFTATGKLKKLFLTTRDDRCVHHGWRGTHRYDIQVLATRVNMGASILFTAAVIRAFKSARSRGNGGTYTVHNIKFHENPSNWELNETDRQTWRGS